jgi:hypothetical protein
MVSAQRNLHRDVGVRVVLGDTLRAVLGPELLDDLADAGRPGDRGGPSGKFRSADGEVNRRLW